MTPVFKLCEKGDNRPAIGTGVRPIRFCRRCYVAEYGDQFQQFKVIIPHRELGLDQDEIAMACAKTGEDIHAGGTVWLDPVETHIPSLIYNGFIEAIPEPKAPAKPKAATGEV